MKPVDREFDNQLSGPVDRLIISLRSYIERRPEEKANQPKSKNATRRKGGEERRGPTDWVLILDCETRTTPDQRLRFGTYQLRHEGQIFQRGAFFEPEVLSAREQATLQKVMAEEKANSDDGHVYVLTRAEFVENVFYRSAHQVGAQIVGFNLPFDLSRLAIRHGSAHGRREDTIMRGGFSLVLSEGFPAVVIRQLSQRASVIRFSGTKPDEEKGDDKDPSPDEPHESEKGSDAGRGFFVDVKTLAAALTSRSHTLESLSALLRVATPKKASEEHGGELSEEYVRYALRDVQTTWECFDVLRKRFLSFELGGATGLYDLYSEASLGKAYLKAMNIQPWRGAQPDFPPKLIGHMLSAYYGGRSEVHIRRKIVPVIHCDFLSMYPTVCTLMGMWKFVIATGIEHGDDTQAIRKLIALPREELIDRLRHQDAWQDLAVMVQVRPDRDLFPVRAQYPDAETTTIGLNHLTSEEPLWFTLADVLVSKILGGKTPDVVSAIRLAPGPPQDGLKPITVAGEQIHAMKDDFYRRLIIHRNGIKARIKLAPDFDKPALDSNQLGIKILANATSYGIFVELNVEDYQAKRPMVGYGAKSHPFKFRSAKFEKPGRYFHPLLATLITGAARLMLALAEFQVKMQQLDWAFCDTDSLAIANTSEFAATKFKAKALAVIDWFRTLNPYDEARSILQLEKVNFPIGHADDLDALEPPECLAISAKRYVLFNRRKGRVVIRKASGHGLGHLMAPYDEPLEKRRERIDRVGVPIWQEDLWREIIRAASSDTPDQTRLGELRGFDIPAASQYAATTPELLRWFKGYNAQVPEGDRVFPFGFLLSLQSKSRLEMATLDQAALNDPLWYRREPRPAAPYFKRPGDAKDHAFDREKHAKIPAAWLKSLGRSLVRYHLHEETKFQGGEYEQRGVLTRRHVVALAQQAIGKEADHVEESEFIGEPVGPEQYAQTAKDRAKLTRFIGAMQRQHAISNRALCAKSHVSHHTVARFRAGHPIKPKALRQLARAAEALSHERRVADTDRGGRLQQLRELHDKAGGRNKLAKLLGVSAPYLGRVLRGEKPMTAELVERIRIAEAGHRL